MPKKVRLFVEVMIEPTNEEMKGKNHAIVVADEVASNLESVGYVIHPVRVFSVEEVA